ncbi:MAG: alpha/beta hydrolase [Lachnospiraceae bacterium]|nr:alpha/beta hydrolase [Lachnospiraceae bacterium]
MPILKLKDVELYYDEFGSGDRFLIQAQQFVSKHLNYVKDLSEKEGFHGFIIRIRGYAPSTLVTEDLGDRWYDVWAQDVCDFADAMGIGQFFYTGHSHGAGIGWHLCMNHPERLRGFFASGCGPHKKDGQATGSARMQTIEAAKNRETWIPFAEQKAKNAVKAVVPLLEDAQDGEAARLEIEDTREFWVNMPAVSAVLNPKKPFPKCETEEELIAVMGKIQVPLLMLGGSADVISTPELMLRSLRAVKNSQLVLFEGVDHQDLTKKCRKEYVAEIVNFCRMRHLIE